MAEGAPAAEAQPGHIQLKAKDQQGSEVQFKIKKSTPLRKLMDAYCSRLGLQASQVRFMVDGGASPRTTRRRSWGWRTRTSSTWRWSRPAASERWMSHPARAARGLGRGDGSPGRAGAGLFEGRWASRGKR